jgi:peptidoglycan biosynthesis protein MviN/MurJ (putative lipid II flippase)
MYSLGETHYLTRIAIINFFLSVAAKVTLFAIYGVPGIAAACTVYPLLNHVVFHRKFLNVLRSR